MNFREGMRRVGIALGISGSIAGGIVGYFSAEETWRSRAKAAQFQLLNSSPAVVRFLKTPVIDFRPTMPDGSMPPSEYSELSADSLPWSGYFNMPPNSDGIESLSLRDGSVVSILTRDSRTLYPGGPSAADYFAAVLFPTAGFIIPWLTVKAIAWIVAGFIAPPLT